MKKYFSVMCLLTILNAGYSSESVNLRTGVILDRASQSFIVMQPGGGVAAYDMQNGLTKWSSANSDKPLIANDGLVVSQKQVHQKGSLALVFQSIEDGSIQKTVHIDLPRKVMANISNGAGAFFDISNTNSQNGPQLEWIFRGKKIRGAAPKKDWFFSDKKSNQNQKSLIKSGLISLDFEGQTAINKNLSGNRKIRKSRIEQNLINNVLGRQFLSQDEEHVLISKPIDIDTSILYEWHIYTKSGELLGSIQSGYSYAPFVVVGRILVFVEAEKGSLVNNKLIKNSPMLTAIDIQSKQIIWKNPVRSAKHIEQLPH